MNTVTIEYNQTFIKNAIEDFESYMAYSWEENVFPNSDIPFVDDAPEGKSYITMNNKGFYFFKQEEGVSYYIEEKLLFKYTKEFFLNIEDYRKYYENPEDNINNFGINPVADHNLNRYKGRVELHYASLKTDLEFIQEEIKERLYLSLYEFLSVLHFNSVISLIPLDVE